MPPSRRRVPPSTAASGAGISGKERAAVMLKVADLIERDVERMALLETLESGKPITQSRGEVSGRGGSLALRRVAGPHHVTATATTRWARTCSASC
jgi:hypothetical protein